MLHREDQRIWVKRLGWMALGAVIFQGILGGVTVKFFLPTPVSVSHAVLAQTFLILTIIIAYSQSKERKFRTNQSVSVGTARFLKISIALGVLIYVQLILGALMRHTASGLAIPDFPTMGGYWWPPFNNEMLNRINDWRFEMNLDPVSIQQVIYHFLHRFGALSVVIFLGFLTMIAGQDCRKNLPVMQTVFMLNILVLIQFVLGILTVLSEKQAIITSSHVMIGALTLAVTVLLILRCAPLTWNKFMGNLK
jgi:cytochrome c oxidase assembly protein subunit 15